MIISMHIFNYKLLNQDYKALHTNPTFLNPSMETENVFRVKVLHRATLLKYMRTKGWVKSLNFYGLKTMH